VTLQSTTRGYALIAGGDGFIGSNVAERLLSQGERVVLFGNLFRPGVEANVNWLRRTFGDRIRLVRGDVRDEKAVSEQVAGANQVFHFAAQVAVTTSLVDPVADFETNARGTLNVLEAIRRRAARPPV
jgi:CDP-paratose 2-epimerase